MSILSADGQRKDWRRKEEELMPLTLGSPFSLKCLVIFLASFQPLGNTLEFQARQGFLGRLGYCNFTRNCSKLPLAGYKPVF